MGDFRFACNDLDRSIGKLHNCDEVNSKHWNTRFKGSLYEVSQPAFTYHHTSYDSRTDRVYTNVDNDYGFGFEFLAQAKPMSGLSDHSAVCFECKAKINRDHSNFVPTWAIRSPEDGMSPENLRCSMQTSYRTDRATSAQ
jgi:hypothetical protein